MHMTNGFREQGGGPELVTHSFTSLTHALLAAVSLVHPYKRKHENPFHISPIEFLLDYFLSITLQIY